MKIKVISIEKAYPPFKMDNGGTIYSAGVNASVDGGEAKWVKIKTYTDSIILEPGAEFISGDNVGFIEMKPVTFKKKDGTPGGFPEYTIKAKKKEWSKSGGNNFQKISMAQNEFAINYCIERAIKLSGDNKDNIVHYFTALYERMVNMIEIKTGAERVADEFENPFADGDIPF